MISGAVSMVRTLAVDEFPFGVETFTAETVQPFVFTEIDVAGIVDFLENGFHHGHVVRVGGADETVVGRC